MLKSGCQTSFFSTTHTFTKCKNKLTSNHLKMNKSDSRQREAWHICMHTVFTVILGKSLTKQKHIICRCIVLISVKSMKYTIARSSKFTLIRTPPLGIQGSWKEESTLEDEKTLGFTTTCCCGCVTFKSCTKSLCSCFFSDLVNAEQGSALSSLYS